MEVFNKISEYYEKLIQENGYDVRSCDYGHPASQKIKFEVISQLCNMNGKNILDVGCGFADFFDFLNEKFKKANYTGVDISPGMIKMASEKHSGAKVMLANILEDEVKGPFDIVTANGIFYLLGEQAELLMKQIITKMYSMATEAIAFNSLSIWADDQQPNEYYADPVEVFSFCHSLTPWVTLRHDYHHRDFTIYMYKQRKE